MDAGQIFKKLKLEEKASLLILNAPEEFRTLLKNIEFDEHINVEKIGKYDFVQVFSTTQDELEKLCVQVKDAGKYDGLFWACYPKGTGKIKSDIKRETVWIALNMAGLRPVSQIAIDETWSALRGRLDELVKKTK